MKKFPSRPAKAKTAKSAQPNTTTHKGKQVIFRPLFSEEWLRDVQRSFPEGFYFKESLPIMLPGEAWLRFIAEARYQKCSLTEVLSDVLEKDATWSGGAANGEWLLRGELKKRVEAIAKRKGRKPEDCLLEAVEQYVEAKAK